MTGPERGFLLLRSRLGDPERKPLTAAQLRGLSDLVHASEPAPEDRELDAAALWKMGCTLQQAQRIAGLLSQEEMLDRYLRWGEERGCVPLTWVTPGYPRRVRQCLGEDAPATLWMKGDPGLLETEKVALVGSRDLQVSNALFAQKVGVWAAEQGYTLVSGNARGADTVAQDACLKAGGRVISVVADALHRHPERERVLYLSEESFDEDFTPYRALSRNRVIHSLGETTFVAQCTYRKGGTWDGTTQNLKNRWSRVVCFRDSTAAMEELAEMGAELTDGTKLTVDS